MSADSSPSATVREECAGRRVKRAGPSNANEPAIIGQLEAEMAELFREFGGRQEARTPDLRVAKGPSLRTASLAITP
jgi:hypothetical protein